MIGLHYDDGINTQQFPMGWETFSYNDIRHYYDCRSRSKDNNKPLPTVDDWEFMRDTYLEVVSIEERKELAEWAVDNSIHWEDDIVPPTLGYSIEPGIPVPPPYYAKSSPGMGRGLFASREIKEGELVHDGTVRSVYVYQSVYVLFLFNLSLSNSIIPQSDVIFPSAYHWRKYVFSLPRDFACDTTDWHWMQKIEEDGPNFMHKRIRIRRLFCSYSFHDMNLL